ncbi:hypothetical protein S31_2457 [Escherichia coli B86]|nr:hypothetical protein S31_2457 [Escherichia coli B86]
MQLAFLYYSRFHSLPHQATVQLILHAPVISIYCGELLCG